MYNKLVTIIIPTYKRATMLHRAISSAIEQSYANLEILVVSDNEPNDVYTLEAKKTVDSFNDDRVRLITQEKHINGAVARNVGILAAKGYYISFLDDDDFIDVDKIEKQVNALEKLDDTWGGVCCRHKEFFKGKLIEVSAPFESGYVYKKVLMRQITTQTNSLLLKREALLKAGLFDEKLIRHQDVQLLVRFTKSYKLYCMNEFLNNLDLDDNANRMKPERVMQLKKSFFASVKDIIDGLTPYERYNLKLLTLFDIGALYIKDGQYLKGGVRLFSALGSPFVFCSSVRKVLNKRAMRKVAKTLASDNNFQYRIV